MFFIIINLRYLDVMLLWHLNVAITIFLTVHYHSLLFYSFLYPY